MAWGLFRSPATAGGHRFRYHLAASLVLLILFQGRHPTLGYFAYPAALASLAVGGLASALAGRVERLRPSPTARVRAAATDLALAALLAVLLPGAGLRTLLAHLRHRGDPAYDARALACTVMADIPPDAVTAVGAAYVLDFYLAGRPAIDAFIEPDPGIRLYDVRDRPFQYAVLGPTCLRLYRSRMHDLVPIRSYGDPLDPFAPYAELFGRDPARGPPSSP